MGAHAGAIHLFDTEIVRVGVMPSAHNRLLALQRARSSGRASCPSSRTRFDEDGRQRDRTCPVGMRVAPAQRTPFHIDSSKLRGESPGRGEWARVRPMRLPHRVLVLCLGFLSLVLGGCFEPPTVVVDEPPVPIAVGSLRNLDVKVLGRSRYRAHEIVAATCDDGACTTEIFQRTSALTSDGWPTSLFVRPTRPGNLVLRVRVVTEDGDELEGAVAFSCIDADEVTIRRIGNQASGEDVVIADAELEFTYDVFGPQRSPVTFSDEGLRLTFDGLEPTGSWIFDRDRYRGGVTPYLSFAARTPGAAQITIHAGRAFATRRIRVVTREEVVSLELHRQFEPWERSSAASYEDAPFDGSTWVGKNWVSLVPVSRLADGAVAVGGGQGCSIAPTQGVRMKSGGLFVAVHAEHDVDAVVTITCEVGAGRAEATVRLQGLTW
jgi:hypothetical protein